MQNIHIKRPSHSYKGTKWKTMKTNKKYLKKDFHGRCAYCGDSDSVGMSARHFQVDHFVPKEKFPNLKWEYTNLMYACEFCNGAKSDYWAGESPDQNIVDNEGIVSPCCAEYDSHICRSENGAIVPLSIIGQFMYKKLKLYLRRHHLLHKLESLRIRIGKMKKYEECSDLLKLYKALDAYCQLSDTIDNEKGISHIGY